MEKGSVEGGLALKFLAKLRAKYWAQILYP